MRYLLLILTFCLATFAGEYTLTKQNATVQYGNLGTLQADIEYKLDTEGDGMIMIVFGDDWGTLLNEKVCTEFANKIPKFYEWKKKAEGLDTKIKKVMDTVKTGWVMVNNFEWQKAESNNIELGFYHDGQNSYMTIEVHRGIWIFSKSEVEQLAHILDPEYLMGAREELIKRYKAEQIFK